MADTVRSLTALEALLADNTTQQISPQDLRDLMVSLRPSYGRISQQNNAAETNITDSISYFPLNLSATVLDTDSNDFDMPDNGMLRYTGTPDRICMITGAFSPNVAGNNKSIHMRLGRNGTSAAVTEFEYFKGSAGARPEMMIPMLAKLSTNDYIEMFVLNATDTTNLIAEFFSIQIWGGLI